VKHCGNENKCFSVDKKKMLAVVGCVPLLAWIRRAPTATRRAPTATRRAPTVTPRTATLCLKTRSRQASTANLNFVTHPFFGHKVTYGRDASPLHPHIKHYYKLHLSLEINTKIRTLMDQLPQEDRRDTLSQIVEGLKKRQQL
jgi:hypothetical protein